MWPPMGEPDSLDRVVGDRHRRRISSGCDASDFSTDQAKKGAVDKNLKLGLYPRFSLVLVRPCEVATFSGSGDWGR